MLATAIISTLAAAVTVNVMSRLGLPVSTSQAIIGSIIGLSFLNRTPVNYAKLVKVFICWILTPIGSVLFAFILYKLLAVIWQRRTKNLITFNSTVKLLSVLIGCYAAYGLGANNVANVMGTFVGANLISPFWATVMGGASICIGVLTYSRNVMYTVGKKLTPLDPFSALVVVLAEAVTLHIFAMVGVPVSSSQAVVGAVVGVGLVKGTGVINRTALVMILVGWVLALIGSAAVAYVMGWIFGLFSS